MKTAFPALCLLSLLVIPPAVSAQIISFASDPSWQVRDAGDNPLGLAQAVCLNASSPSPCPSGATQYGFTGSGWGANLAAVPGAQWIWAPGVTGATQPAELATYTFSQSFMLDGNASAATLFIAADDFASVRVNGMDVGSIGSTSNFGLAGAANSSLTAFDIAPFLGAGSNMIEIKGQNGIGAFAGGCSNCTYAQHPAGVVFGGSIETAPVPVPAALWLFGSGLLGLIGVARHRAARSYVSGQRTQ